MSDGDAALIGERRATGSGPSNPLTDALRLNAWRWDHALLRTTPGPFMIPVAAWVLIGWTRLGGFVLTEPQAFVRFLLIGIYGWLGLGLAMWLVALVVVSEQRPSIWSFFRIAGNGHLPVLTAAFIVAFIAGLLGVAGIGLWISGVMVGLWMPTMLTAGVMHATGLSLARAAVVAIVPQLVWLATVGRRAADQLSHLL